MSVCAIAIHDKKLSCEQRANLEKRAECPALCLVQKLDLHAASFGNAESHENGVAELRKEHEEEHHEVE